MNCAGHKREIEMPDRHRVGSIGLLGVSLHNGLLAATHMPDCKHFDRVSCCSVVDEIPNATDNKTANTTRFRALVAGADARLLRKQS